MFQTVFLAEEDIFPPNEELCTALPNGYATQADDATDQEMLQQVNQIFGLCPREEALKLERDSIPPTFSIKAKSIEDSIPWEVIEQTLAALLSTKTNKTIAVIEPKLVKSNSPTPSESSESTIVKQCSQCQTRRSPGWRRGSNHCLLCNKCGLRWKRSISKQQKCKINISKNN